MPVNMIGPVCSHSEMHKKTGTDPILAKDVDCPVYIETTTTIVNNVAVSSTSTTITASLTVGTKYLVTVVSGSNTRRLITTAVSDSGTKLKCFNSELIISETAITKVFSSTTQLILPGTIYITVQLITNYKALDSSLQIDEDTALGIDSIELGTNTVASGPASAALGLGTTATAPASTIVGKYGTTGTNDLFVVGNGTGTGAQSKAFSVTSDGTATLNNKPLYGYTSITATIPISNFVGEDANLPIGTAVYTVASTTGTYTVTWTHGPTWTYAAGAMFAFKVPATKHALSITTLNVVIGSQTYTLSSIPSGWNTGKVAVIQALTTTTGQIVDSSNFTWIGKVTQTLSVPSVKADMTLDVDLVTTSLTSSTINNYTYQWNKIDSFECTVDGSVKITCYNGLLPDIDLPIVFTT